MKDMQKLFHKLNILGLFVAGKNATINGRPIRGGKYIIIKYDATWKAFVAAANTESKS